MTRNSLISRTIIILIVLAAAFQIAAIERFPKPEFETKYKQPLTTTPQPANPGMEIFDMVLLGAALSLASWLVLKKRSRKHIFRLMLACLIYFGFIREGCVCSVGSIQNLVLAISDSSYVLPVSAAVFFALPILFALFAGRVFCSSVCPLGGVQDLVAVKPVKLPVVLKQILSVIPYLYLGFTILFASTGTAFLICRFDPFVGFFRFGGDIVMIVIGIAFLILGVFISRPYCRFFCPYGVILGWMSWFSKKHLTITPDECINCKLCENSCPDDSIVVPPAEKNQESRRKGRKQLTLLLIALPVISLLAGMLFSSLDISFSKYNKTVQLAEQIAKEEADSNVASTLESRTFRASGIPVETLMKEAVEIRERFNTGGWIIGIFLGIVFIIKMINLTLRRRPAGYEPDKSACVSCGRCIPYCPVEHDRLTQIKISGEKK